VDIYFSSDIKGPPFRPFSRSHLWILLILTIINILLFIIFKKNKEKKFIIYILAGFLSFNEIFYILWYIFSGSWSLKYSLPLQLCDLAAIVSIIMLFTKKKIYFELVYFWGLGGSLQALLTPGLYYPYPHIIFFNFFILHYFIITAVIYMIVTYKYRPTIKSIIKAFIITNICTIIIGIINYLLDANYMFLRYKPNNASLMDYLGPWPYYILSLEVVFLIVCFILYIPYLIKDLFPKNKDS